MVETDKRRVAVLVIGTGHEYQRHQDTIEDRQKVRADFERLLREAIAERSISLIAEEAGDNGEVWERLKQEEAATPRELRALFGGTEAVGGPQDTIAKRIADERPGRVGHVDIRPPRAEEMTIEERDEAMAGKTTEVLGGGDQHPRDLWREAPGRGAPAPRESRAVRRVPLFSPVPLPYRSNLLNRPRNRHV